MLWTTFDLLVFLGMSLRRRERDGPRLQPRCRGVNDNRARLFSLGLHNRPNKAHERRCHPHPTIRQILLPNLVGSEIF